MSKHLLSTKSYFFFLRDFFAVDHFLTFYWICYKIASVLCFGFLASRNVGGILSPRPGIKPTPLALEGEVLTAGPPGKSPKIIHLNDKTLGKLCNLDVEIGWLYLIHKDFLEITKNKISTPAEKWAKDPNWQNKKYKWPVNMWKDVQFPNNQRHLKAMRYYLLTCKSGKIIKHENTQCQQKHKESAHSRTIHALV